MGNSRIRDEHNDRTMVERIDPLMGTVLDKQYRIDFRLASGGFGAIYRATHVETAQQYALKILHAELATADANVIARFRREAATLSQLRSPNTIQAYGGLGEAADGSLYIVMELLHGESLYEQFRAKGVLAWERVVKIGRQVCTSLAEAHALGIIHRDLKPANIHLEGTDDFVKVLDFGIAKITHDSELDSSELTQAGQMIGTFDYMAPEQMVGGQCSGKTDIYTLGIVMYEMICGRRPFSDASSPTAMLAALLTQAPPPLGVRGVPEGLEQILLKCLEREPQHRYDDVNELALDLDRLMTPVHDSKTVKVHTPAPVIIDSEATVFAQPRAKRGTPPQSYAEQRARRGSEPPPEASRENSRAQRESSPPNPNVVRREGSSPAIPVKPEARAKRESSPYVVRRDRDSQPVPLTPKDASADPNAWQSLQLPKRDRESGPVARYDGRDSQPVPVKPPERPERPTPAPYQAGAFQPAQPYPGYPHQTPSEPLPQQMVTLRRAGAPIPQMPHTPAPQIVQQPPTPDPRLSAIDPNAWRAPPPPRGSMLDVRASYDMAGSQSRDVLVRRIVWGLALVLGLVLILVIASRL